MRRRPSAEVLVFIAAIACVVALLATWIAVFRRLTLENFELHSQMIREHVRADQIDASLQSLQNEHARRTLQIVGEGSTFLLCLLLCMGTLFFVAKQRQQATFRMRRMLALTTHELKTPIAGVRALIQSLQLGTIPQDQQQRLLAHGVQECDRLEHLSETILAYQRTLRRVAKTPERLDLGEMLARLLEHRSDLSESHVPAGLWVLADADAFRVIIENLLDNARKYGGGKPPTISHAQSPGYVRLSVSDRGIGFVQDDTERIFDVFSRGPGTSGQHGSGLGLYISRELAKQMGGTLVAHSDGAGTGATFTLELRSA